MGYLPPPPPTDEWIEVTCIEDTERVYVRGLSGASTRQERHVPARVDETVIRDAKVGAALLIALVLAVVAGIAQGLGLI